MPSREGCGLENVRLQVPTSTAGRRSPPLCRRGVDPGDVHEEAGDEGVVPDEVPQAPHIVGQLCDAVTPASVRLPIALSERSVNGTTSVILLTFHFTLDMSSHVTLPLKVWDWSQVKPVQLHQPLAYVVTSAPL